MTVEVGSTLPTVVTPVRKPYWPLTMVPRVGEHTGLAQALSNTTPLRASASMFGIGTWPCVPASSG